ncbi:MAG: glycosyltransferase family 4 protein [Flavobacteriales bacterium]|nr:glycosyltransferase family 4 protein [Flavobacteriales bacterium]MCB9447565.1 glycosyltransferase family 4 protein [Flavobacteriales bacterium]
MRKIVLFSNDFPPKIGGVANYSFHIACELQNRDMFSHAITSVPQSEVYPFPVEPSLLRHKRKLGQRTGDGLFFLRKVNTMLHYLNLHIASAREVLRIRRTVKSPLVFVTANYDYQTGIFIRWCRRMSMPYGIVLHGLDIIRYEVQGRKRFAGNCRYARFLVFNSVASSELFKRHMNMQHPKSYVLYPGVNTDALAHATLSDRNALIARFGLPPAPGSWIVSVCALVKRKGIHLVISAMKKLLESNPQVHYLIAGEGDEGPVLQALVQELGIGSNVHFLGHVTEDEKCSLLNAASLFAMPNLSLNGEDFEGFGISFLEALYFGNMVIGGNDGGVPEAVPRTSFCRLVNADAVDAVEQISEQLQSLLSDMPSDKSALKETGRKWVKERFSWNLLADRFVVQLKQWDEL